MKLVSPGKIPLTQLNTSKSPLISGIPDTADLSPAQNISLPMFFRKIPCDSNIKDFISRKVQNISWINKNDTLLCLRTSESHEIKLEGAGSDRRTFSLTLCA